VAKAETEMMMTEMMGGKTAAAPGGAESPTALIARLEKRVADWVQTPACASIASIAYVAVTIAPEAELGLRELRLVTSRGVSNPLPFQVGELREYARAAMRTATIQILGKEELALRKRPETEAEEQRPNRLGRGQSLPLQRQQGAAAGVFNPGATVGAVHRGCGAGLVSTGARALRRAGQGTRVCRRLPLPA
jgi:hypothetical protein